MMLKRTVLNNGLVVVSFRMPHMASVSIGIWINVGVRNENAATNGVSHLLEHLLFKGTKRRGTQKIKEDIEGKGGSFNGFTAEEFTCYFVKMLSKDMGLGLDVLSDMVLHPLMRGADVEKEKRVVVEEINMYKDMPTHYVHELLTDILWPGQPLGLPLAGTVKSVNALGRDDLARFKGAFYVPANMVVSAVGDLQEATLLRLCRRCFGGLPSAVAPRPVEAARSGTGPKLLVHRKKTEQTHLAIGIHAPHRFHPDRYAVGVLNVALGANMSSRLFQEVRERRALCYEISSSVRQYRDAGSFVVSAGVETKDLRKALEVILGELSRVRRSTLGKEELKRAKEYYKGQLLLALEDTMSSMLWHGEKVASGEDDFNPTDILRTVDAIGAEDLMRVADSSFTDGNLNLAVIGPVKGGGSIKDILHI